MVNKKRDTITKTFFFKAVYGTHVVRAKTLKMSLTRCRNGGAPSRKRRVVSGQMSKVTKHSTIVPVPLPPPPSPSLLPTFCAAPPSHRRTCSPKDPANTEAISTAAKHWGKSELAAAKTRTMTSYCRNSPGFKTVPDPYYGGPQVSCAPPPSTPAHPILHPPTPTYPQPGFYILPCASLLYFCTRRVLVCLLRV